MILSEIWKTKPNKVVEFCNQWSINNYSLRTHGIVDFQQTVRIRNKNEGQSVEIPFKIGKVTGDFVFDAPVTSFDNFPSHVTGDMLLLSVKQEDLGTLNVDVDSEIQINRCGLKTLKDIHKKLKKFKCIEFFGENIESNILGLALIPGLTKGSLFTSSSCNNEFCEAIKIMRNHLGNGKKGMLAAHRALLDADLEKFAEL